MGGDHGCAVTVPASLAFVAHQPDAQLLLVGRRPDIETALKGERPDRIELVHADEVVESDDAPAILRCAPSAIRRCASRSTW